MWCVRPGAAEAAGGVPQNGAMPATRVFPPMLAALLAVLVLLTGCSGPTAPPVPEPGPPPPEVTKNPMPQRKNAGAPNIIFVLTDDLDRDLVRYMPQVQRMQREGVNFSNFTVTNSLCCPSRATIMTGKYPHNTGVYTNNAPNGGYAVFRGRNEERSTIGTQLQRAGFRTGFMGKYINGYQADDKDQTGRPHVPQGWNDWAVTDAGYSNYNYTLNHNGRLTEHGKHARDYLTDVLSKNGQQFILDSTQAGKPFFLELSTFAPHSPSTAAPRDRLKFRNLIVPRTPSFNEKDVGDKASWLRDNQKLKKSVVRNMDAEYRRRVRSVQAVDDMIASIRSTLEKTGQARSTYLVFGSDNGYHLGQHRLNGGKQSAFDTDILVPLVVTGPRVPAGRTVDDPVQTTDLRPTFGTLAGAPTPADVDGVSFARLLHGQHPRWRDTGLVEHVAPGDRPYDPDRQNRRSGAPPNYKAIRTNQGTYVEYDNGDREYYDHSSDPYQLNNIYGKLSKATKASLHDAVQRLRRCTGREQCWQAGKLRRVSAAPVRSGP
jgi:N-acetylglucosamine-6-sulfatase